MKLTGKEMASLCVEENGKPRFTICQLNWYQLLNNFIVQKIWAELQKNDRIERFVTQYITIDNIKISKESKVKVIFQASLKKEIPGFINNKYNAIHNELEIKDFYNHIIDLFDDYACELDTDINNINLELVELEILKEDNSNEN